MVCFVVCCRLFSGVHGLLCGVFQTVQWCEWRALWCVADCSVVYMVHFMVCCRDCSVVYMVRFVVCCTVQWCTWSALWWFSDCSVVWMACFWLVIAYITLFSALLSRLTALACGSTWVTSFIVLFVFEYPPKWCTYNAGMAGATWNCSHLGTSPVYTIQPCTMCKATYVRCMRV